MEDLARRRSALIVVTAIASVGFAVAWILVIWLAYAGVFGSVDTALGTLLYGRYGHDVVIGRMPYRGFSLEYPPLALPAFVVPTLIGGGAPNVLAYRAAFEGTMLACGLGLIAVVAATAGRLATGRRDLVRAVIFVAATPILLGPVIVARFDLWPALLTSIAIAMVLRDRPRIGAVFLGLAILAKAYPIVLVPLLAAHVWRRAGRREAVAALAVGFGVLVLGLAPFVLVARAGTIEALRGAFDRPLQIESLGAASLVILHGLAGLPIEIVRSFGSENLGGRIPQLLVPLQMGATVVAVAAVWARLVRGPSSKARLVVAAAATLCAYVAFGKVFSPQYLIWLVPAVAILPGRVGRNGTIWLAAILLLTERYFPVLFSDLVDRLDVGVATLVLVRDLALVGLALYLAKAIGSLDVDIDAGVGLPGRADHAALAGTDSTRRPGSDRPVIGAAAPEQMEEER
jgi:hypothetical protein